MTANDNETVCISSLVSGAWYYSDVCSPGKHVPSLPPEHLTPSDMCFPKAYHTA